ncbi:lysoplasmalogenase [Microbacterium pumilum]|uniref:Lysoplasmalogenase n=1 Tax=Microbacterium pumilum TaxID=344165 RepID=A0ABP5DVZ8_9MICO
MHRLWIGFIPFAVVSVLHVGALSLEAVAIAAPTKLLLMPLLAVAVLWGGCGSRWGTTFALLFTAIALSWLGDGADTFFPAAPTIPTMLVCFGLAHLCYIWLFWRILSVRPVPPWAVVYGLWWGLLLAVLWPALGGLLISVAIYGLVLGGTAVAASRCHPLIAVGGAFFLASDTILAFEIFTPAAAPPWSSPVIMLAYCLGQGLIAAGVIVADRLRRSAASTEMAEVAP